MKSKSQNPEFHLFSLGLILLICIMIMYRVLPLSWYLKEPSVIRKLKSEIL